MKILILALAVAVVGIAAPTAALAERAAAPQHFEQPGAPEPSTPFSTALALVLSGGLVFLGMIDKRTLQDLNSTVQVNLPAAGATAITPTLDLGTTNAGRLEDVEIGIVLPATPNLVDAKTVTLTLKDSPDDITYTAVASVPAQVATGGGGVGAAAIDARFKLPLGVNRYLQLTVDVLAAGGVNTDTLATLALFY